MTRPNTASTPILVLSLHKSKRKLVTCDLRLVENDHSLAPWSAIAIVRLVSLSGPVDGKARLKQGSAQYEHRTRHVLA